jgi:AcrR family transcriptional regulator
MDPSASPRRTDAQRNRASIIDAARKLFVRPGEFSMSEVARRAGVGQGTLYRNFADRSELAAALMAGDVAHFETVAADHRGDPDALFVLLRSIVETMSRSPALSDLARVDVKVGSDLAEARRRVGQLLRGPLRDAKAARAVRPDLTVDDVFLISRMVKGALEDIDDPTTRATAAARALNLALSGVSASPGH